MTDTAERRARLGGADQVGRKSGTPLGTTKMPDREKAPDQALGPSLHALSGSECMASRNANVVNTIRNYENG
jgi:hypothetical protein